MKTRFTLRLIPAALIGLWAGTAGASGFQLLEQNASGLGNAYAGSAAVAENASTVFFNPAGMTQLEGRNISAGLAAIITSYKFSNGASSVGTTLGAAGNGGDGGGPGFVPNAYMSMAVAKDIYLGLGIGAPFGLKTEFDSPWIGAAQSIMFDVKTINVNPSIAYRVNEKVSVGFGLNWQKLEAEYKRTVGIFNVTGVACTTCLTAVMKLSDDAWGWNAGLLFNVSPTTKVGISYRSQVEYKATGNIALSSNGSATGNGTLNSLNALGGSSNVSANIKLPDTLILSATQKLDEQWEMLGDLSWTGWSSIPYIDIMRTSGVASGQLAQRLDTKFRDTWRIALGANYKLRDNLKLKFGIAYDQTPVKGADSRLVSLPDNDRTWLSFGTQWQPVKGSTLDFGVTYLYIQDASIHNNQPSTVSPTLNRGLVDGTFKGNVWILGAQYSMNF
jgi:long-chain fatty acid transport protein